MNTINKIGNKTKGINTFGLDLNDRHDVNDRHVANDIGSLNKQDFNLRVNRLREIFRSSQYGSLYNGNKQMQQIYHSKQIHHSKQLHNDLNTLNTYNTYNTYDSNENIDFDYNSNDSSPTRGNRSSPKRKNKKTNHNIEEINNFFKYHKHPKGIDESPESYKTSIENRMNLYHFNTNNGYQSPKKTDRNKSKAKFDLGKYSNDLDNLRNTNHKLYQSPKKIKTNLDFIGYELANQEFEVCMKLQKKKVKKGNEPTKFDHFIFTNENKFDKLTESTNKLSQSNNLFD